ncbi:hypothetical protein PFAG_03380 [Plasmodium falciparum Santa Lucia]|uniref:CRAL-TRIO domain-containing protein n=1 Tax=Plasmodium falciparum Santa Lucia TaxID=478859 RepID=W7FG35_PLAFA|nr:hypothetical protein PFAG_03380 [Plasmodium falciparum Santa Lucia]
MTSYLSFKPKNSVEPVRMQQILQNQYCHNFFIYFVYLTILYVIKFCISKLLIEGKVEQWRVIIDLTSCSVLNIPIATLKDISKNLSCNYRSRLCKMLVLSAPLVVTGIWHMLKSIIPVVTQQKITITSSEKEKKLLDQVQANQLERKSINCQFIFHIVELDSNI